jgi:prepilin-type processing-associated H-X9-DG protein
MLRDKWKFAFGVFWGFIGLAAVALVLFPIFGRARDTERKSSCFVSLNQIRLATAMYVQDYDEKYPFASNPTGGWASSIYPYMKSTWFFQCPMEVTLEEPAKVAGPLPFDPKFSGVTDYYFNAQVQGLSNYRIEYLDRLILFGDGNNGMETTDASYSKFELPDEWRKDTSSPACRHLGHANYAFADGHVKALAVENIAAKRASGKFYFQPR